MILSPAGRVGGDRPVQRWGLGGAGAPPDLNDFPPAGEAGGKIINDFINDFRPGGRAPAGEAGGKKSKIPKIH